MADPADHWTICAKATGAAAGTFHRNMILYGEPASATDVLRRCAAHSDVLVPKGTSWCLRQFNSAGGIRFERPVSNAVVEYLWRKAFADQHGQLTSAGQREGMRLQRLYLKGKI